MVLRLESENENCIKMVFLVCTERFHFLPLQWYELPIGESAIAPSRTTVGEVKKKQGCKKRRCRNAVIILFIKYVRFYFDTEIKSTFTLIEMNGCEHQILTHTHISQIVIIDRQAHTSMDMASIGWVKCNRIMPPFDTTWVKKRKRIFRLG